jgi:phi LC3 family holin
MINWKVRFKNPVFIFQLILSALAPALASLGLAHEDLTTWGKVWEVIQYAYTSPHILALSLIGLYNALNDPTTKGHTDSKQAMNYNEPK